MRISILTFLHVNNYGAELQAFALQWKLRKMGYDVTVLDSYQPQFKEFVPTNNFKSLRSSNQKKFSRTNINLYISRIFSFFSKIIFCRRNKIRTNRFYSFHKEYTNLSSEKFCNYDSLYSYAFDFSHFIVGSDQVWNYTNPFSPEPYFLTFVDGASVKKISYAASIGHSELPEDIVKLYRNWINDFSAISLREQRGVEIIQQLTDKKVSHVLDPTMLLSSDDWCDALSIRKSEKEGYVLLYLLSKSPYSINLAKEVAKSLGGCKIIVIESKVWSPYSFVSDIEIEYCAGPKEFVELFINASFVITNSFHGTAFSVNLNKPFYSTPKANSKVKSRFISLLSKVRLEDRLLYDGSVIPDSFEMSANDSISLLSYEREMSIKFLESALQ